MSQDRLTNLTKILKERKYLPTPVKRVFIPKANGKKRPLGILTGDDKLIQEVVRIILENIYESVFSDYSHGFRPGKSCHTALTFIQKYWKGTKWIIDMDIKGYLDHAY
jgi:retron-type reverse transcriptase